MKIKRTKFIFALILCLLISVLSPSAAFAKGYIQETKDCSVSVVYAIDSIAVPNAQFGIYHVANIYYNQVTILTNDFNDYSIAVKDLPNIASQLEVYTQVYDIAPVMEKTTNASGIATFSGLKPGVYLVSGGTVEYGGSIYSAVPCVVYVPSPSEDNSKWEYDVIVAPKNENLGKPTNPDEVEPVDVKVLKVWADRDNKIQRPQSVEVQLVADGVVIDTVTLNEEMGWTYLWEDLEGGREYAVIEQEVPAYYTVSIKQEGITFIVTNTSTITPPIDDNGGTTPENPPAGDDEDDPSLPQTGQLWWPVPVLAVVGIALVVIGFAAKKECSEEA